MNLITHIQGLRGLAIFLVIFYHLCPSICPNGYYGVDLFLVISGYFLFSKRFEPAVNFDIINFGKKKILRILPPVFFTISITLLISIAFSPAIDMVHAYVDAKYALIISTNTQLNAEANAYFSTDARSFSLMHLWYICIFIQAMLLFTCIFYIWNKFNFSKKWRIISILILAIISLTIQLQHLAYTFNIGGAEYNISTYCWTSARIWEFVIGGLITLIPYNQHSKLNNIAAFCALVALIILAFTPTQTTKLIPIATLLSGILILSGKGGIASSVLNSSFLLTLGKYSFSLYLMHWPIIWIMEYLFNFPLSATATLVALTIIAPLTLTSYQIFEKQKTSIFKLTITALIAPVLAILILLSSGFKNYIRVEQNSKIAYNADCTDNSTPIPHNSPEMNNTGDFEINLWGKPSTQDALLYHMGDTNLSPSFVLLGDSHAIHLKGAFDYLGKIHHWSGIYLNSYVHPFYGAEYQEAGVPDHENTKEKHEILINWLKEQESIKYVVISQWWSNRYIPHKLWNGSIISEEEVTKARTAQLRDFCKRINNIGKQTIIIADTPTIRENDPYKFHRRQVVYGKILSIDQSRITCTEKQFNEKTNKEFITFETLKKEGVCRFLTPHVSLFKNGIFSAIDENLPILGDTNHLTLYGAIKALTPLCSDFVNIINEK